MFKKIINLWLPVIIWAGFIFFLSSIPNLSSGLEKTWDTLLRKIAHLTEYAILFILLARAMKKPLKFPLIVAILYAASDEIHQSFVPGRCLSLADFFFDSAGVLIGYLVWPIIIKIKKNSVAKS